MKTLPEWIYYNGQTYYFKEWQVVEDDILDGWWFCGYWPKEGLDSMLAETHHYFLVCADPYNKEDAEEALLEKLNKMEI